MTNEIQLPKRRYKIPESKAVRIREATNNNEKIDLHELIKPRDLRSINNAHSSHGYSKQGRENYDQIEWDKNA